MRCIVTAGPTFEPLDQVRRLTNFSTGRLGSELARFLTTAGHEVLLWRGEASTFNETIPGATIESFSTTSDLASKLEKQASSEVQAVFHAAAVSDFRFGRIFKKTRGDLEVITAGKIPTQEITNSLPASAETLNSYYAELIPTAKIISRLRSWFPGAFIVGWKYEVDGARPDATRKARAQIAAQKTNACVLNGPAYGAGFGVLREQGEPAHAPSRLELFRRLESMIQNQAELLEAKSPRA